MSYAISEILTVGQTTPVSLINPITTLAIKISNKSPYDLQYTGYGAVGSDWIPSGTEYLVSGLVNNLGSIALTPYNTSGVFPVNPAAVLLTFYVAGDTLPNGGWPVTIPFQTVNTSVASTSSIKQDMSTPGSSVIEVTPSDALTSTWSCDNEGNVTINGNNAGVLTTLLQLIAGASPSVKLAASTILTQILGTLRVNGASAFDGGLLNTDGSGHLVIGNQVSIRWLNATSSPVPVIYLDNGNSLVLTNGAAASPIYIKDNNNTTIATFQAASQALILGGDLSVPGFGVNFNIGRIKDLNTITGSGSGTFNHGLSGTPSYVGPMDSTTGSQTMSANTFTSTQVSIVAGAAHAFRAICYR